MMRFQNVMAQQNAADQECRTIDQDINLCISTTTLTFHRAQYLHTIMDLPDQERTVAIFFLDLHYTANT
jgi:hypothetical protein